MTNEQIQEFTDKLNQLGLPYESLKVFGAIRCNVHIVTVGNDSARKWAHVLSTIFPHAPVKMVETIWDAKENKNTVLRPTKRHGWLVAVAA